MHWYCGSVTTVPSLPWFFPSTPLLSTCAATVLLQALMHVMKAAYTLPLYDQQHGFSFVLKSRVDLKLESTLTRLFRKSEYTKSVVICLCLPLACLCTLWWLLVLIVLVKQRRVDSGSLKNCLAVKRHRSNTATPCITKVSQNNYVNLLLQ